MLTVSLLKQRLRDGGYTIGNKSVGHDDDATAATSEDGARTAKMQRLVSPGYYTYTKLRRF